MTTINFKGCAYNLNTILSNINTFFPSTATQVCPLELQEVFQETSSNIFQINANGEFKKPPDILNLIESH